MTYEVKTNTCLQNPGCLAGAEVQLQGYIDDSAQNLAIGDSYTALKGAAGLFGYGMVWTAQVTSRYLWRLKAYYKRKGSSASPPLFPLPPPVPVTP